MSRGHSLRRRLLTVSILGSLLALGSLVMAVGMRGEVQARLSERASLEALLALDRVDLESSFCTVGTMSAGRGALDGPTPSGLPSEAWQWIVMATRHRASEPQVTKLDVGGRPMVVVARADSGAGVRWVAVEIATPASLRLWRLAGLVLLGTFLVLTFLVVDSIRVIRRAADRVGAAVSSLAADLEAPVPDNGVVELEGVSAALRAMAARLVGTYAERDELLKTIADRERLAALGRVAAGIAHEVRNPLAAMKLHAELAREMRGDARAEQDALDVVVRECDRLDRMVSDLLVAGASLRAPVECDFAILVAERVALLAPWAATRNVTVQSSGAGSAKIDVDAVTRAIDNLLRNAIEASPTDGVVTIETVPVVEGVELRVRDDGPGVPHEMEARLFEPFATTKPRGTGLGLALARMVALAHGGELTYERRDSHTQFALRIKDG